MKKYVKPELIYEQFELTQHIADCAWELQNDKGECQAVMDENFFGVTSKDLTLFNAGLECYYLTFEEYCYQNSTSTGFTLFKS